jgi:hypothetical protein
MFWGRDRRLPFVLWVCGISFLGLASAARNRAVGPFQPESDVIVQSLPASLCTSTCNLLRIDSIGDRVLSSFADTAARALKARRLLLCSMMLITVGSLCRRRRRCRWVGIILPIVVVAQVGLAAIPRRIRLGQVGIRRGVCWPIPEAPAESPRANEASRVDCWGNPGETKPPAQISPCGSPVRVRASYLVCEACGSMCAESVLAEASASDVARRLVCVVVGDACLAARSVRAPLGRSPPARCL